MLANIFGDWYWIVLAIIVLFGGSQLPKLARNSGEALKEFRKAHTDEPGPAAAPPALTSTPVPVAPTAEERITLSRAELDALLAAREARAKAEDAKGAGAQA
jgi:TatA/E family protein of Tat protein translocase